MEPRPADRAADPASPAPPPGAPTPPPALPSPAVAKGRPKEQRSARDMAMSLLVLLVPIALLLGFYRVLLDGDEPVAVDPAPAVAQARSAGAFPVVEPVGLDRGWQVSLAIFRAVDGGRVLRVGYRTPAGGGAQLLQSNVAPERLLPAELGAGARAAGAATVPGGGWQRYTARPGERALVLLRPDRTVVVVGAAAEAELGELAAALR